MNLDWSLMLYLTNSPFLTELDWTLSLKADPPCISPWHNSVCLREAGKRWSVLCAAGVPHASLCEAWEVSAEWLTPLQSLLAPADGAVSKCWLIVYGHLSALSSSAEGIHAGDRGARQRHGVAALFRRVFYSGTDMLNTSCLNWAATVPGAAPLVGFCRRAALAESGCSMVRFLNIPLAWNTESAENIPAGKISILMSDLFTSEWEGCVFFLLQPWRILKCVITFPF